MLIGHSLLGFDNEFGYRLDKPIPKIGETKSTSYSTVKTRRCTMSCRIIAYALMMIFCLGSEGVSLMHFHS